MPTIKTFIKQHPVLTYYVLTFAISWGAMLAVILTRGIPANQDQVAAIMPVAIVAMLGGPSLASILTTALADGTAGLRELFSRLRGWRAGAGWYAFALFTAPIIMILVPLALSLRSTIFLPSFLASGEKMQVLVSGIAGGIFVGFCEELGWTGFVMPRLRARYGILTTGVVMGVLWGAWHIMANGVLSIHVSSGGLSPTTFLAARSVEFMIGWLLAFRILMVWVYDRAASLPLAMLMHATATASALILTPAVLGVDLLIHDFVLAAAMWCVVGAIALASGGRLEARKQPKILAP